MPLTAVFVGAEALVVSCAEAWLARGHHVAALVTQNPEIAAWAEKTALLVCPPGPGLAGRLYALGVDRFDWLFSIANLTLLEADVLAAAEKGAINFHDGPLPERAGLNVPVWALLEGAHEHAITWHLIERRVDAGAVILRGPVPILPDDTAFSLNARCFAAGVESFPQVIAAVEAGLPERTEQDLSRRRLYRRTDRPAAMGHLDFSEPAEALVRLVRALDYGGYRNPLTVPKIFTKRGVFVVKKAVPAPGAAAARPGEVLAVAGDTMTVACGTSLADEALAAAGLETRHGNAPAESQARAAEAVQLTLVCWRGEPVLQAAAPGEVLPKPDRAALDQAMRRIAASEELWAERLQGFTPPKLSLLKGQGGSIQLNAPAREVAAALSLWAPGGWAYANAAVHETHALAPEHVMPWVPVTLDGATLADRVGQFAAAAALARVHPGWARDLLLRVPGLGPLEPPPFGLSESGLPIPGCALSIVAEESGCRLYSETLSAAELALWAGRARFAAAFDIEEPCENLNRISPADSAIGEALNATACPVPSSTIVAEIEAQVDRTPDAVALIFEDRKITYATLDAEANRLAHVLRALGVRPEVPVGLHLRRGPLLVAAALGIMKAGGAYVPLDPTYPAERLRFYAEDSGTPLIVTEAALDGTLPAGGPVRLCIDTDPRIAQAPTARLTEGPTPETLAYILYTSGSTGQPKGVMVEHRQVVNFFAGMDAVIPHDPPGVWLALTSISFDISVLELFWTLARGFSVVLTPEEGRLALSSSTRPRGDFGVGLFFWGNDDGPGTRKYALLLEAARFADAHGFSAVWTPERHFHAFGGPYPNPAVTGAAVAAVTSRVSVRAGSCVAPLHHPIRIAEDWAVIDNLSNGRIGLAIASGWHPVDFVLRPENAPPKHKDATLQTIDTLRRLWRGEAVEFDRGDGKREAIVTLPRPLSRELPLWLTVAGNPDSWRQAGEIGAHVLTHLLGQSIPELADKIAIYRDALRRAGHDPRAFTVTLMLHTFLAPDRATAREIARAPMKAYLAAAVGLVQHYAWAFPAFKRPAGAQTPLDIDLTTLSPQELDAILDFAFERYFEESGLFGTVEDALARIEQVRAVGVNEIACLIDYGIPTEVVLESLKPLAEVVHRLQAAAQLSETDFSLAAQIIRHKVTYLQCTPTMARLLLADEGTRAALGEVREIMLGGEALPGALAAALAELTGQAVLNLYGPTETTIWSSAGRVTGTAGTAPLGRPIANTRFEVRSQTGAPLPIGVEGELWIAGAGVARGYWRRPGLTAERFVTEPSSGLRYYRTGDRVRIRADGAVEFLGRGDGQVKIRGHRIELGEVEAALGALPGVTGAVVNAQADAQGDLRLVAYVTGMADVAALAAALADRLPPFMRPDRIVRLDRFPETPNRKIDRAALPNPFAQPRPEPKADASPPAQPSLPSAPQSPSAGEKDENEILMVVATVWKELLGLPEIGPRDHFFHLGGHSLLALQAHRRLREALGRPDLAITDLFRFPVLADLAHHLAQTGASLSGKGKRTAPAHAGAAGPSPALRSAEALDSAPALEAERAELLARRRAMRQARLQQV